ncbi:hypothetical protein [Pseudorhodoferax sp. Leaf267]|uniref:hypothetical protein n=1 Tax=Pseudorhodoferax sp. Leaf267 TaxID=1736316 RepID=UPI00071359AA|nr:hypothetical protein [Pseudorhodoferax sp. Leaf267]KQP23424.1 hypothetical protein ASF43_06085 [Pseudorhodoferax sp. Leaf267]
MKASTVRVAEVNAAAIDHYKAMRGALLEGSDEDRLLCEIVVTAQLALLGHEVPFRIHAIRLFGLGVSRERLERVILAGIGVTLVLPQAALVLDWIEAAQREHAA